MTMSLRMYVRLAQKGDKEACQIVLKHYKPLLQNLARRYTVHMSGEDAFSTACVYAVLAIREYDLDRDMNLAYHIKCFVHDHLDQENYYYKKYNDHVDRTITNEEGHTSDLPINVKDHWVIGPDEALLREEEKRECQLQAYWLKKFYENAGPTHKRILELRKQMLSIRQIARELNMSHSHVHRHIQQCWEYIKEKMKTGDDKRI